MGYYGMPSAKLPPSKLTPVEAAVAGVSSSDSVAIIQKLVYNAAVQPKEEKFRRVKTTNAKIQQALLSTQGALDAMIALGWQQEGDELVIPTGKYMTMVEVRIVDAALEKLKKADQEAERQKVLQATKA